MEFSGQYLTYEDYKALGGTSDLTSFNLLEFAAQSQVDLRTHNRLKTETTIPQKVKLCIFELVNKLSNYVNSSSNIASKGNVASENTDGYSVSYITISQIDQIIASKKAELEDIMMTYLYGVIINNEHILYNGV